MSFLPYHPNIWLLPFSVLIRPVAASQSSLQAFVPSRLLYAVWNYADYMAGYAQVYILVQTVYSSCDGGDGDIEQQDAHEFLMALLGGLQSHGKENHPLPAVPMLQQAVATSQTPAVCLPDELDGPAAKKPRIDQRPKSGYRDYFTRPVQSFGEVLYRAILWHASVHRHLKLQWFLLM